MRQNGRVEATPEEILAQLERYVASQRAGQAPPKPVSAADTFISRPEKRARHLPRPLAQAAPAVLTASSCALTILVFQWLDPAIAAVTATALLLAGAIGVVRRVPFAGSWTLGLIVAGLLIRFS